MNIVLMGTGPFAVPAFQAILNSQHKVLGLVTRPDRPVRGKGPAPVNPARELAVKNNLEVIAPESINEAGAHEQLKLWNADLFVVCDYGQILRPATLELAKHGGINLHGSLLPKYRGAAPIQWAIYNGETETGVTVIHMTPLLDAGPSMVQVRTPIGAEETNVELEPRLAHLGVDATLQAIAMIEAGQSGSAIVQDGSQVTKAPCLQKSAGEIDWSRSAAQIRNQIRAWQPWPKSFSHWIRPTGEPVRLIVDAATVIDEMSKTENPGTVFLAYDDKLQIQCGEGILQLDLIQPAGKKAMSAAEFLRGHQVKVGEHFGAVKDQQS